MRKFKNYTLTEETHEEQRAAGRYNPATVITFRDKRGQHRHALGKGTEDAIDVYRESGLYYVLTRNYRLEYVGLEVFEGADAVGDIFMQSAVDTNEVDINGAPYNLIKHLLQWFD